MTDSRVPDSRPIDPSSGWTPNWFMRLGCVQTILIRMAYLPLQSPTVSATAPASSTVVVYLPQLYDLSLFDNTQRIVP